MLREADLRICTRRGTKGYSRTKKSWHLDSRFQKNLTSEVSWRFSRVIFFLRFLKQFLLVPEAIVTGSNSAVFRVVLLAPVLALMFLSSHPFLRSTA
jgi:hypothetical protein